LQNSAHHDHLFDDFGLSHDYQFGAMGLETFESSRFVAQEDDSDWCDGPIRFMPPLKRQKLGEHEAPTNRYSSNGVARAEELDTKLESGAHAVAASVGQLVVDMEDSEGQFPRDAQRVPELSCHEEDHSEDEWQTEAILDKRVQYVCFLPPLRVLQMLTRLETGC
jgi:hypothetical protein